MKQKEIRKFIGDEHQMSVFMHGEIYRPVASVNFREHVNTFTASSVALSYDDFIAALKGYGFVEIADLLRFLACACGDYPDETARLYMHSRLRECLSVHDNGSAYFDEIKQLLTALSDALPGR